MKPEDIETEYQRRLETNPDARWGWSFMYTPEASLKSAKVVLVGLNPAGDQHDASVSWEHVGGNAYVDQPWGRDGSLNPLQQQVVVLFQALSVHADDVFAANFIPFCSPSWGKLPDQQGALAFGRSLWTGLLKRTPARLVVSIGKQSGREMATLLEAGFVRSHEVEWGKQKIDEYAALDGRTVLALPHLSRFKVFGGARTAAASAVSEVARRVLL